MSGPIKKVRIKLAIQGYRVGDVIEPCGTLRQWLVENGYGEVVVETPGPVKHSVSRAIKKAAQRSAAMF